MLKLKLVHLIRKSVLRFIISMHWESSLMMVMVVAPFKFSLDNQKRLSSRWVIKSTVVICFVWDLVPH